MGEFVSGDEGPPLAHQLPTDWGPFHCLEILGSGGMGVVYRAIDTRDNREIALKTLHIGARPTDEAIHRLKREAATGAALKHPGIVPVLDAGFVDHTPYLAMPFVEGCNLSQAVAGGKVTDLRARIAILRDVAAAIGYAHRQGVIHRDLKPPNVLIGADGVARVTDFGVAKRIDESSPLTAPGQMLGTILYMPPEQLDGDLEKLAPPADVYALGIMLYEMLAGTLPFTAPTFPALAVMVLTVTPKPPSQINPATPPGLETICQRAMAKEPMQRYPTAQEMSEDLDRWLRGETPLAKPAAAGGPGDAGGTRTWWKRLIGR